MEALATADALLAFKDENKDEYLQIVNEKSQEIITNMGGLDHILELCLTHPNFGGNDNIITGTNLSSLQQMFSLKLRNSTFNVNLLQSQGIKNATSVDNYKFDSLRRHSTRHTYTTMDVSEYKKNRPTVIVDATNNLYFHFLSNSSTNESRCKFLNAEYLFYDILLNKWYTVIALTTCTLLFCISMIFILTDSFTNVIGNIAGNISCVVGFVYALSWLFGANIDLIFLVCKTFNFWYKILNLFWVAVGSFVVYFRFGLIPFPIHSFILAILIVIFAFFMFCIVDALCIPSILKVGVSFVGSFIGLFWALFFYFYIENGEADWKVLGILNIDFKTTLISSWLNLALFSAKPQSVHLKTYLKELKKLLVSNYNASCTKTEQTLKSIAAPKDRAYEKKRPQHNNSHVYDTAQHACYLFKKPRFKWQNVTKKY